MITAGCLEHVDAELSQAEAARAAHLEGRARVNARRAAGAAIRGYYEAHGIVSNAASAMEWIADYRERSCAPGHILVILDHLVARVNPDFSLPAEIDLLDETRQLIHFLREE